MLFEKNIHNDFLDNEVGGIGNLACVLCDAGSASG